MADETAARVKRVKDLISDTVGRLLYYDRKEDNRLPVDAIDELVRTGAISVEEMVAIFETELRQGLES